MPAKSEPPPPLDRELAALDRLTTQERWEKLAAGSASPPRPAIGPGSSAGRVVDAGAGRERMVRTHKYLLNLAHSLEVPHASDLWASATWQGVLRRGDQTFGRRTTAAYLSRPCGDLYDLTADPDEVRNLAADVAATGVLESAMPDVAGGGERPVGREVSV